MTSYPDDDRGRDEMQRRMDEAKQRMDVARQHAERKLREAHERMERKLREAHDRFERRMREAQARLEDGMDRAADRFEEMRRRYESARARREIGGMGKRGQRRRPLDGGEALPVEPAPQPKPLAGGAEAPLE